ncbi:hypothetical protein DFH29DRAFT_1073624 [Suillus ampliporus]|nr:hypothetical protein DFH29DRAFT_1073624 [Suillus ampliporus]
MDERRSKATRLVLQSLMLRVHAFGTIMTNLSFRTDIHTPCQILRPQMHVIDGLSGHPGALPTHHGQNNISLLNLCLMEMCPYLTEATTNPTTWAYETFNIQDANTTHQKNPSNVTPGASASSSGSGSSSKSTDMDVTCTRKELMLPSSTNKGQHSTLVTLSDSSNVAPSMFGPPVLYGQSLSPSPQNGTVYSSQPQTTYPSLQGKAGVMELLQFFLIEIKVGCGHASGVLSFSFSPTIRTYSNLSSWRLPRCEGTRLPSTPVQSHSYRMKATTKMVLGVKGQEYQNHDINIIICDRRRRSSTLGCQLLGSFIRPPLHSQLAIRMRGTSRILDADFNCSVDSGFADITTGDPPDVSSIAAAPSLRLSSTFAPSLKTLPSYSSSPTLRIQRSSIKSPSSRSSVFITHGSGPLQALHQVTTDQTSIERWVDKNAGSAHPYAKPWRNIYESMVWVTQRLDVACNALKIPPDFLRFDPSNLHKQ